MPNVFSLWWLLMFVLAIACLWYKGRKSEANRKEFNRDLKDTQDKVVFIGNLEVYSQQLDQAFQEVLQRDEERRQIVRWWDRAATAFYFIGTIGLLYWYWLLIFR